MENIIYILMTTLVLLFAALVGIVYQIKVTVFGIQSELEKLDTKIERFPSTSPKLATLKDSALRLRNIISYVIQSKKYRK